MSFSNLTTLNPNKPFDWFAKGYDDKVLTEFEEDYKENEFDTIDKENLKEFGLYGRGVKLWYSTEDGIINIGKRKIEFYLEDEEQKLIKLSGRPNEKYNDIIQFKGFHHELVLNQAENAFSALVHDSFHFGYKHVIHIESKGDIYFQFIFRLPMGKPMKLGFRFAPTFNLKGKLFARINGKEDPEPTNINILANGSDVYEKDFI